MDVDPRCPATSAGCARSTRPWSRPTWPAATPGGSAGRSAPLLKAAPLSKSAVSRIVGTLKAELEAWRTRSLADLDVFGLYLDAIALRVRSAGKVVSVPVLGVVAVLTDGQKQLVALELCRRRDRSRPGRAASTISSPAASAAPGGCVIDGHPGLRKAVGLVWPAGAGPALLPSTSSATSSARRRSTPSPRSGPTSTGSSTPRAPRRPAAPSRPSSGSGRHAAPAWSAASRRAARSCSRSSSSRSASGRRSGPRT